MGYADGRVDIQPWSQGSQIPARDEFARQNLPLIVYGRPAQSQPVRRPANGEPRSATRSASGDRVSASRPRRHLYAAADDQTVGSLAKILIHAGAIRAMQLDINSYWVTLSPTPTGAAGPNSLLPGMTRPISRYLSPDDRDFFAVYLR